jgi:hypothetical protein
LKAIKLGLDSFTPENYTGIVVRKNGDKFWYKEGKYHREDGPAIELPDGTKKWYKEGKLHRIDGPAIECPYGGKEWYIEGKKHRIDGPAIESLDGTKYWYLENKLYTPRKLLRLIDSSLYLGKERGQYNIERLKFLTEKEIEEFPIIPGMKEDKDFKKIFEILEEMEK